MSLVLKASKIQKTFKDPTILSLLKGISLEIHKKETIAIMGASGEGKSTLLHILGTLEAPDQGQLFILNKKVEKHQWPILRNQHIGFIFQSFYLLENATVLKNILMPAAIARQSTKKGSTAYKRALLLLEKVSLLDRKDYRTKLLSGGEKQRVCIARALCNNPSLILADEPTGNLDNTTSKGVQNLLLSCVKEEGKSLILVTHDYELAKSCDHIFTLENGLLKKTL